MLFRSIRSQAGVYKLGSRLVAVNRPAREGDLEIIEPAKARQLFGRISVRLFDEAREGRAGVQSELWRIFLLAMGGFLLLEAILILPPKPRGSAGIAGAEARTA